MKHFYGWIKDSPDNRDLVFEPKVTSTPVSIDLRVQCPPIYNQGELGSCTANAIAAALDFQRVRQHEPLISPSRLFIYYNERKDDGTVKEDAGATIRESVKAVKSYGACPEVEWPYIINKFTSKPTKQAYKDALNYEDLTYRRISPVVNDMQSCLAGGAPFVIGISVYQSFESSEAASTGMIPMPQSNEQLLGGHAVLCVGYEGNGQWICRNSWGTDWGDRGYFFLPQEYLLGANLASDFWTLEQVK